MGCLGPSHRPPLLPRPLGRPVLGLRPGRVAPPPPRRAELERRPERGGPRAGLSRLDAGRLRRMLLVGNNGGASALLRERMLRVNARRTVYALRAPPHGLRRQLPLLRKRMLVGVLRRRRQLLLRLRRLLVGALHRRRRPRRRRLPRHGATPSGGIARRGRHTLTPLIVRRRLRTAPVRRRSGLRHAPLASVPPDGAAGSRLGQRFCGRPRRKQR